MDLSFRLLPWTDIFITYAAADGFPVSIGCFTPFARRSTQDRLEYIGETVIGGHTIIGPKRLSVKTGHSRDLQGDGMGSELRSLPIHVFHIRMGCL